MTFLVAIAIFINVISGESLGVFNIVGFYDCVVLTLYVVAVLFIAAYANMLLNEKVNNALDGSLTYSSDPNSTNTGCRRIGRTEISKLRDGMDVDARR